MNASPRKNISFALTALKGDGAFYDIGRCPMLCSSATSWLKTNDGSTSFLD